MYNITYNASVANVSAHNPYAAPPMSAYPPPASAHVYPHGAMPLSPNGMSPMPSCSEMACTVPSSCCDEPQCSPPPTMGYYHGQSAPPFGSATYQQQPQPIAFPSASSYADPAPLFSTQEPVQKQPTVYSINPQMNTTSPEPSSEAWPSSSTPSSGPMATTSTLTSSPSTHIPEASPSTMNGMNGDQGPGYLDLPSKSPAPFSDHAVAKAENEGECSGKEQTRTVEEKAQDKFKQIRFEELHIITKIGSGSYGTVYKVHSLPIFKLLLALPTMQYCRLGGVGP